MQTTHTTPQQLQFHGVGAVVGRQNIAPAGAEPDTDQLTQATTARMREAMQRATGHPLVVGAVRRAMNGTTPDAWANQRETCLRVWEWVRANVRFVQDDDVLRATLGMPDELELLIEPPLLLAMPSPAGDCDDFTMLTGAMVLSAGVPAVEITTVCADPTDPRRWSHVYLTVRLDTGERLVMDCSHGGWLGWEAPQYYARRGWGEFGGTPAALNAHRAARTSKGAQMHGLATRTIRSATPGAYAAGARAHTGPGMGEVDWGTLIPQITTGTFDVIKQVTQKPGQYIQGPGGQVIATGVPGAVPYPTGGFTLPNPFGNTYGSGAPGLALTPSTLLIGGVALAALVFAFRR